MQEGLGSLDDFHEDIAFVRAAYQLEREYAFQAEKTLLERYIRARAEDGDRYARALVQGLLDDQNRGEFEAETDA